MNYFDSKGNPVKTLDELKDLILRSTKCKGYFCSVEGNRYERIVHGVVKNCTLNGTPFNTQASDELGGSSSVIDLQCNFRGVKDLGIEVKKYNAPDWTQSVLRYSQRWMASPRGRLPLKSKQLFNEILGNIQLFNGDYPPFVSSKITHGFQSKKVQIYGMIVIWMFQVIPFKNYIVTKGAIIYRSVTMGYFI